MRFLPPLSLFPRDDSPLSRDLRCAGL